MRWSACSLALWAVCLSGAAAQAAELAEPGESREPEPSPAPRMRNAIDGEVAYFTSDDSASALHIIITQIGGRYVLSDRLWLTGRIGLVNIVSSPDMGDSDLGIRPSNPEVFAWLALPEPMLGVRWRAALGVSGPLTTIDRGKSARLHRTGLANAQGMDGLSRMWRWAPNRTGVIAGGELELDAADELQLLFEAWPALLIPSREEFLHEPLDLVVPLAIAAVGHRSVLSGGPRLRATFMPTADVDHAQFAFEPFVAVTFGGVFVEARYTLNLDEPLAGPRGPQVWGVHLLAGGEL